MQEIAVAGRADPIFLPSPTQEVLPGVVWGQADEMLTPAYWAVRAQCEDAATHGFVSKSGSFVDEVAFCLLGGFGITAELADAYFARLKESGILETNERPEILEPCIHSLLSEPVQVQQKTVRYRFPAQRARRLARALPVVSDSGYCTSDALQLRTQLLELEGIGPKTASWIVRNWLGSDMVAILDVHVVRACQIIDLFPEIVKLPDDYSKWESRFLEFSNALSVRASVLDAVLWSEMRTFSPSLIRRFL